MRRFPPIALAVLLFAALSAGADPSSTAIDSRIKRVHVDSTALASVGYSKRLRALEVEFRSGAVYRYLDVEPGVYEALLSASSKARYYDQHIRHNYRSLHVRRRTE
jgi:hypothetical protein